MVAFLRIAEGLRGGTDHSIPPLSDIYRGKYMLETLYKLFVCHALGDYVLQIDFLAKTEGTNLWHLIMHCILYTAPFAVIFGLDSRILMLFITHVIVDAAKARFKVISYLDDQIMHIGVFLILYLL